MDTASQHIDWANVDPKYVRLTPTSIVDTSQVKVGDVLARASLWRVEKIIDSMLVNALLLNERFEPDRFRLSTERLGVRIFHRVATTRSIQHPSIPTY